MNRPASSSAGLTHNSGQNTGASSSTGSTAAAGSGPAAGTSPAGLPPSTALPTTPVFRPHGPTSRELLRVDWKYPVYSGGPLTRSDGAAPASARGALPREAALRFVAG